MPKKNKVRFTTVQMEAIRSGMNPGLTMVVGPPGTGEEVKKKRRLAVVAMYSLFVFFASRV